jgi:hypothetical protein
MASKMHELKPPLFKAGQVSITAEAFQRLKEAQVEPQLLLERHTRGDWDWPESPARWLKKDNRLVAVGERKHPILSVYQLYPSSRCIAVETVAGLSKTSITNWPDADRKAPEYPLESMEAAYQVTKHSMEKASFARSLMNGMGTVAKESKSRKGKQKSRDMNISR